MIVEIKKSHIIKTLLDPTEPLRQGTFGSYSEHAYRQPGCYLPGCYLSKLPPVKKNCTACALGCVMRSILNPRKTTIQLMAGGAAQMKVSPKSAQEFADLESFFEAPRGPDYYKKDRRGNETYVPNMKFRRELAEFVRKTFQTWTLADINGVTWEQLKHTGAVRIPK